MVEIPKIVEKPAEELKNNSVIMSSAPVEDVEVEHEDVPQGGVIETSAVTPRKPKADPLAAQREQMESAERALAEEKAARISAERERDAAKSQIDTTRATLAKSESEKIIAQEAAITTRVETAAAEVENAERALEEAIDTGKPAKEQIRLQKVLAESVYKLKGAEGAKAHFDNWKEKEKNKPVAAPAATSSDPYANWSAPAKSWLEAHPRFRTETKYRRTAERAHEDATDEGVALDSPEYFRRINAALAEAGLEGGNDTTVTPTARKSASGTSTAIPAAHDSAGAGASGGNAAQEQRTGRRTFKLDGEMRRMAITTYGKNSSFKLSDEEAYKRYAAKQLEIRDKRANGERI